MSDVTDVKVNRCSHDDAFGSLLQNVGRRESTQNLISHQIAQPPSVKAKHTGERDPNVPSDDMSDLMSHDERVCERESGRGRGTLPPHPSWRAQMR